MMSDSKNFSKLASGEYQGIPEIKPSELRALILSPNWASAKVRLLDVRMPNEFTGELGHVADSELVTLGPDLQQLLDNGDRKNPIVFICRSGARSAQATGYAVDIGYENVANLSGGMIRWNEDGLPVSQSSAAQKI
jgi:rhodanese-related sulfurtransferase